MRPTYAVQPKRGTLIAEAATVGRNLRQSCDWDLLESVKDSYDIYDVELPSN